MKYILYARKSTEEDDRQVLSIEAQLVELQEYAAKEKLEIVASLCEAKTAKEPGRIKFAEMLSLIERGKADGIIAWHPDRLARNSVDGGKIIHFVDRGLIRSLKFPTFWFKATPQGLFMLNIAFGQSKYYIDSLSENVRRGLRQKVRRGEYPGLAPIGYINDVRTKSIVVDKKRSVIIRKAFTLYAKNSSRLEDISNFLAQSGIHSRNGKRLHRDRITFILSNPFYYGHFRYGGEIHEGKHQPVVSKKLFDQAQEILKQRGRPHHKQKNEPQAFCGLLSCASCGMMITGEYKVKKQKNGNVHNYTYYHCTKKSKTIECPELCIRQEELDKQLSSLIKSVSLPPDWAEELNRLAVQDHKKSAQSNSAFVEEVKKEIKSVEVKLQRLLDGYLDQVIEQEIYRAEKSKLLFKKKSLEEKISSLLQKQNDWLEPMQEWIKDAQNLNGIARDNDLFAKKVVAKEIFGSNLLLGEKTVRVAEGDAPNSFGKMGGNQWDAIRASHLLALKKPIRSVLVRVGRIELPSTIGRPRLPTKI
ncbi:recombinase family protein [Patescibacteria group bacterium]|nr:recombinase family protein [Patescibacteria group bacterium]